jgi:hypothetical protein
VDDRPDMEELLDFVLVFALSVIIVVVIVNFFHLFK